MSEQPAAAIGAAPAPDADDSAQNPRDIPTYADFVANTPVVKTMELRRTERVFNRVGRAIIRLLAAYGTPQTRIARIFAVSISPVRAAIENRYAVVDNVAQDYDFVPADYKVHYPPKSTAPPPRRTQSLKPQSLPKIESLESENPSPPVRASTSNVIFTPNPGSLLVPSQPIHQQPRLSTQNHLALPNFSSNRSYSLPVMQYGVPLQEMMLPNPSLYNSPDYLHDPSPFVWTPQKSAGQKRKGSPRAADENAAPRKKARSGTVRGSSVASAPPRQSFHSSDFHPQIVSFSSPNDDDTKEEGSSVVSAPPQQSFHSPDFHPQIVSFISSNDDAERAATSSVPIRFAPGREISPHFLATATSSAPPPIVSALASFLDAASSQPHRDLARHAGLLASQGLSVPVLHALARWEPLTRLRALCRILLPFVPGQLVVPQLVLTPKPVGLGLQLVEVFALNEYIGGIEVVQDTPLQTLGTYLQETPDDSEPIQLRSFLANVFGMNISMYHRLFAARGVDIAALKSLERKTPEEVTEVLGRKVAAVREIVFGVEDIDAGKLPAQVASLVPGLSAIEIVAMELAVGGAPAQGGEGEEAGGQQEDRDEDEALVRAVEE